MDYYGTDVYNYLYSAPYNKSENLNVDKSQWDAYVVVSNSNQTQTVLLMARRKYIPPYIDVY